MKTYCLGAGGVTRCKSCLHEKNWKQLNEMPDSERLKKQSEMQWLSDDACRLLNGALFCSGENNG